MSNPRDTALAYWRAAQARDWDAFGALLTDDVVYDLPQTGERISGRERYVQFNREYPGQWSVAVERAIGEGDQAATWCRFSVDGEEQPALTFFEFEPGGRIARVTDFWPEPYAAPPGREHLMDPVPP